MPRPPAPGAAPGISPAPAELTVTEQSDFDAAVAAAEAGDNARAAQLFETFLATYPGGPLSSEAQFRRGEALAAQGDWQGAARSYLDAFSGAPQGPLAPRALYRLAVALGERGQFEEACLTLTEVDSRYPGSEVAGDVAAMKASLRCQ
jgi:tol-pal system protein YbgF